MLVNFITDPEFTQRYQVTFSYRHTPLYEEGFRARVATSVNTVPLRLIDLTGALERLPTVTMKKMAKLIYHLLLIKYFCILWNTLVLFSVFGRYKIDVLHINNGGYPGSNSCMAAVFAARLRGIRKIVYVVNNIAIPYRKYWRWFDYFPDRLVARSVTRFVCGSAYATLALRQVLGLSSGQVVNIPNGIAPRRITESRIQVMRRLNLHVNRIYLAIVATLEERKGHVYLLKAMQLLKREGLGSTMPILLIEGIGSLEEKLRMFVEESALTEEVRFIGREDRVFNLMNAVDVIILPSVANEDFPNVVLEAMSLGKPVIASRISGTPEQIEDRISGILVEPCDIEGLKEAIRLVVEDNRLRETLSRNAKKRFEGMFSSRVAVARYDQLYDKLIKGART